MVEYDPAVIKDYAERLYARAARLQFWRAVLWGLIGFGLTYVAVVAGGATHGSGPVKPAVLLGLLFALAGYSSAREAADRLRLDAQTALCQVRIELNTSRTRADNGGAG